MPGSEARFLAFLTVAADAFIAVDEDQCIIFFNRGAEQVFNYQAEEVLGRPLDLLLPPQVVEVHRQHIRNFAASPEASKLLSEHPELAGRRKDGTVFPAEISIAKLREDGRTVFLAVLRDITERKRTEETLRRSEECYRWFFEHAVHGMFRSTVDGRLVAVNRAMVDMLGYASESEVFQLNLAQDVYQTRQDRTRLIEQSRKRGWVEGAEVLWKRKNGTLITVRLSGRPLIERGEVEGFAVIAEDVTERRRLQAQLLQAQKMEAIGRLAGGLAHDFANLLSVIIGRAEIVRVSLAPEEPGHHHMALIAKAAARGTSLVQQLLAFSRRQVLQPKMLDLNAVVTGMLPMLQRLIGEHIQLHLSLGSTLARVQADPAQLEQVLLNLAINARDAMPQGGWLTFSTANVELDDAFVRQHPDAPRGPHVMLTVADTGAGMDDEVQAHLFETFFTTKEPGKGTGLGLATVYGIVTQHDGYISVHSEPGHGATFRIYLPRVEDRPPTVKAMSSSAEGRRGSETILIVEDEQSLLDLTREILATEGYRVLAARDPLEAVDLSKRHAGGIHLLLTDVIMPNMNGRELADRLLLLRPGLKVLYVSGYAQDLVGDLHLHDQARALLEKPVAPADLARKVREVLDAPPIPSDIRR